MSKENIERIKDVIDWYSFTMEWLQNFAGVLHEISRQGNITGFSVEIPDDLMFLTPHEIDSSLNKKLDKLSMASSFQLFASFEGTIRFDAKHRQKKARVGKDLKNMIRRLNKNLKDIDIKDIIDCWCERYSIEKRNLSTIKGLFQYRHWLAHGRYWDDINLPVRKSAITPKYIYQLMRDCYDEFKRHEPDFEW